MFQGVPRPASTAAGQWLWPSATVMWAPVPGARACSCSGAGCSRRHRSGAQPAPGRGRAPADPARQCRLVLAGVAAGQHQLARARPDGAAHPGQQHALAAGLGHTTGKSHRAGGKTTRVGMVPVAGRRTAPRPRACAAAGAVPGSARGPVRRLDMKAGKAGWRQTSAVSGRASTMLPSQRTPGAAALAEVPERGFRGWLRTRRIVSWGQPGYCHGPVPANGPGASAGGAPEGQGGAVAWSVSRTGFPSVLVTEACSALGPRRHWRGVGPVASRWVWPVGPACWSCASRPA